MKKKKTSKDVYERYSFDALKSSVEKELKENPDRPYSIKQLLKAIASTNPEHDIRHVLDRLAKLNRVNEIRKGQFQYAGRKGKANPSTRSIQTNSIEGRIEIIRSGAAYLISDQSAKDIYIPEKYLNGALHGDQVKITLMQSNRRTPDGKVLDIIRRETNFLVGTFRHYKGQNLVYPDSQNHRFEIHVSKNDALDAKHGDKVIVQLIQSKSVHKILKGKVIEVMDKNSVIDTEMKAILINNGFALEFSEEANQIARDRAASMKDNLEWPDRRDFRSIDTFTIDPETAKDFDDALSYQILPDGNIEVGVHIADASHYLEEGSVLDQEAFAKSTSVYLVDRALPMLPEVLSGNVCSLMPQVDRLTFSVAFTFNLHNYKIIHTWIGKSVIHSNHRFTYENAQESLDQSHGLFHKELSQLNKIAKHLRKKRFEHGSIGFESPEYKFNLDPTTGMPISIYEKTRSDTHLLIEEYMLLANKAVAEFMHRKEQNQETIPFVYRVHDLPDMDKLKDLSLFAKDLGYNLKINTPKEISKSLNQLYEATLEDENLKLLQPLAIRTMAKAAYSTNNIGHYGLAFDLYSHFTSPIRRYSDILAHRILYKNIQETHRADKKRLEEQCKHISNQERKAMEAERDSVKFFQFLFIKDHVGNEYDGFISGMIERGVFVELEESHVEGFIPFDSMEESFMLAENRLKAMGRRSGLMLAMGDKIRIKVEEADMISRRITFSLIEKKESFRP